MCWCAQPDPLGDLTTELERNLGKIVKQKYNTDFYILYRYPLAVRLLPCYEAHGPGLKLKYSRYLQSSVGHIGALQWAVVGFESIVLHLAINPTRVGTSLADGCSRNKLPALPDL